MKDKFKDTIENMRLNNEQNNLIELLDGGIGEDIIYNALRAIYKIALNAPKFKEGKGVCASFQYADMDSATAPISYFVDKLVENGLKKNEGIEKCFKVLGEYYNISASYEEYSSQTGAIRNDDNGKSVFRNYGIYCNFNEIPKESWDFIEKYIIKKMEES